jgi:CubicO group peptidase (beta-lactamase class C family)
MQGTPTGPPDQAPLTHDPASNLTQLLEQARQRSGLPALAVAYVRDGRVQDAAAIGVRRVDRGDPVQIDDRFHVGSVGKAMTASVIAKLIEDGRLRWESKVSEVLSDVAMRPEYRDVTLEQLLQHRGGIPPYTDDIPEARMKTLKSAGTPMQQRAAFIAQVLNEPPTVPPGTVMIYSNAGYALAGHMAERVTKKSWEEIMTTMLFPSLGMSGSGLGWPATAARPDQPYGHFDSLPNLRVQGLDDYEFGHFLTPAGDVHCTVKDLARFVAFHLEGLRGQDGWLKAETIRRLHRPPGTHRPAYAGGWMVEEPAGGKARHWHVGSAGTFFASVALYPDDGVAIVGLSNAGFPANPVLDEVTRAVMKMSGLNPTNEAK